MFCKLESIYASLIKTYSKQTIFSYFLSPFSGIYRVIIAVRCFCYSHQIFRSKKFPIPLIIVGNITIGGTGKTPLVIWLANILKKNGYNPGVVSRGYGGKNNKTPTLVFANSDPKQVGDEPVLIAKRTQLPIVVCRNRVTAVERLLAEYNCNVVIADDGMQHYVLERDIEIAVIDGQYKFGNGFCLPAGPLREPMKRLKKVDFIVSNSVPMQDSYSMTLQSQKLVNVVTQEEFALRSSKQAYARKFGKGSENCKVHAIAGIGNPERFFNYLQKQGFELIRHPFRDHHAFNLSDFNFSDNLPIIMTEKDAVKCIPFADKRFWYLPIEAELDVAFEKQMLEKLNFLIST